MELHSCTGAVISVSQYYAEVVGLTTDQYCLSELLTFALQRSPFIFPFLRMYGPLPRYQGGCRTSKPCSVSLMLYPCQVITAVCGVLYRLAVMSFPYVPGLLTFEFTEQVHSARIQVRVVFAHTLPRVVVPVIAGSCHDAVLCRLHSSPASILF